MAGGKFTRTQEKQYTGWVACPPIGTQLPGMSVATDKEKPWVLSAPDGVRVISAATLSSNYLFKNDKGVEPINGNTAKAKMRNGIVDWTQVVRNTANALPVMARHIPGSANGGLGHFEIYPEGYGTQYLQKVAGNVFVRMFALLGGLRNIATPAQAAAVTPKPTITIAQVIGGVREKNLAKTLPIPRGMREDYAEKLSKFYSQLQAEVKAKYNKDLTNEELFNSGYLGITFRSGGHRFNIYNSGSSSRLSLSSTDMKKNIELGTDVDKGLAEARKILLNYFANPRKLASVGDITDFNSKDYTKFENCVTAELLDKGIILRIKDDVQLMDLLRFKGFTGEEKFFKYEGGFNSYGVHTMLVGFKDGKTWQYSWGSSTTLASETVWTRNRVIVDAMEKLTGKLIYSK